MAEKKGVNTWVRVLVVLVAAALVSIFIIKGDPELAINDAKNTANTVADVAKEALTSTGEAIIDATVSEGTKNSTDSAVAETNTAAELAKEITEGAVAEGEILEDAIANVIEEAASNITQATEETTETASEVAAAIDPVLEQVEAEIEPVVEETVPENVDDE